MQPAELRITKENAVLAHRQASPEQKKMLEDLFGAENLKRDITEVVTSYEEACKLEGITPLTLSHFDFLPEGDREAAFANHQLDVIIRVLNEGWIADYSDRNQNKWVIIWVWTGSGFSFGVFNCGYSSSYVGARRSFVSEEIARFFVKQFSEIYIKTLTA